MIVLATVMVRFIPNTQFVKGGIIVIKNKKGFLFLLSLILLCNGALAETFDQKLEKIRKNEDFVYSADPNFLHGSFALFKAINSVLEAIKKNKQYSRKKIKDVIVRKRGSEFRISLAPYDSYDLLNTERVPIFDMVSIEAVVDSKTYAIKELKLCSGECGLQLR